MTRRVRALALALAFALSVPACGAPSPASAPASPSDAAGRRAAELVATARAAEPAITTLVTRLASEQKARMHKLEHRLKTEASCARKLRKVSVEKSVAVDAIVLDDTVRYTMVIDDAPLGHHREAIEAVLTGLACHGHRVANLKNYWPRDDNYSGVNTVLTSPDGLHWELQFHTPASVQVQADTRAAYEELRRVDTPVERKRALFDQMTAAWNAIPVPEGMLGEERLDPKASLRHRPRP